MPAKKIKKKCAGTFSGSDRYDNGRKAFRQTDPSGKNREDVSDFRQRQDPASEEYPGKDTIQYQKRDSKRQRDLKDPEKISEYESKQGHILVKQERICSMCDPGLSWNNGKSDHQSDSTAGNDDP